MVCFQNSRNRSSTAREEPAAHRINDVNPRNGSATSLANSQSSPSPGPPYHPPSPGNPSSFCLAISAPSPLCHPWKPPFSIRVRPRHDPTPRRDPAAGPLLSLVASTPALSPVVFTCLRHHSLTVPVRRRLRYHSLRTLLPSQCPQPSPPPPVFYLRNSEITDSRAAVPPGPGRTARKGFLHLSTHGVALRSLPTLFSYFIRSIGGPPW